VATALGKVLRPETTADENLFALQRLPRVVYELITVGDLESFTACADQLVGSGSATAV